MQPIVLLFLWFSSSLAFHGWTANVGAARHDTEKHKHHVVGKNTIADKLHSDERFARLVGALSKSRGLNDELGKPGNSMTIFAPVNEAFDELKKLPDLDYDMDELLQYHTHSSKLNLDSLYDGHLIQTNLGLESLGGGNQYLRINHLNKKWYLNMYATIVEEIEAENGFILVVDKVVIPPPDLFTGLFEMPSQFSTLASALQSVKLDQYLKKEKALTLFVPTNTAWDKLGVANLAYLFGSQGKDDLEMILKFHISSQLWYLDELNEKSHKHEQELSTCLKNSQLKLKASWNSGRGRDDHKWNLEVNGVKASFHDVVAENGVAHVVSSVLIPDQVKLPHPV